MRPPSPSRGSRPRRPNRPHVTAQPVTSRQLSQGLERFFQLLAPTYGPRGGHVAYKDRAKAPELLDDSATIVRRVISLGDPTLDVGGMLLRNLVWRVGQQAGDGGVLAAILLRAIFRQALRLTQAGVNAMQLARGIRAGQEVVLARLRELARPVSSEDELSAVALHVTGDRALAGVVGEMRWLLGPSGHVRLESYVAPYLEWEYIHGGHVPAQMASLHFHADLVKRRTVLAGPRVAVVDGALEQTADAVALLEAGAKAGGGSLLILARRVGHQALGVLLHNAQVKDAPVRPVAVQVKALAGDLTQTLADLATLSGATLLGAEQMRTAPHARPADLGRAQRAEVTQDALVLAPTREQRAVLEPQLAGLRARLAQLQPESEEATKLAQRLAGLSGGMGQLHLGAATRLEGELRRRKARRALRVTALALESGLVPGGGAALLHSRQALDSLELPDPDAQAGVRLLHRALAAPMIQLLSNACVPGPGLVLAKVAEAGPDMTFDLLQERLAPAWEAGVLDVAGVVETAFTAGVSGGLMALTTDAIVYHRYPEESMEP